MFKLYVQLIRLICKIEATNVTSMGARRFKRWRRRTERRLVNLNMQMKNLATEKGLPKGGRGFMTRFMLWSEAGHLVDRKIDARYEAYKAQVWPA